MCTLPREPAESGLAAAASTSIGAAPVAEGEEAEEPCSTANTSTGMQILNRCSKKVVKHSADKTRKERQASLDVQESIQLMFRALPGAHTQQQSIT